MIGCRIASIAAPAGAARGRRADKPGTEVGEQVKRWKHPDRVRYTHPWEPQSPCGLELLGTKNPSNAVLKSASPSRPPLRGQYRTVLDRWRRCHAEGTVITNELAAAEQTAAEGGSCGCGRLSGIFGETIRHPSEVDDGIHRALVLSAVRHGRAAAKEAEAARLFTRARAPQEMSRWRQREEDIASYCSLRWSSTSPSPSPLPASGMVQNRTANTANSTPEQPGLFAAPLSVAQPQQPPPPRRPAHHLRRKCCGTTRHSASSSPTLPPHLPSPPRRLPPPPWFRRPRPVLRRHHVSALGQEAS